MRASLGTAQLAKLAGAPVVPMAWASAPQVVLKSWDRFVVPAPFGRGVFVWGAPIMAPRDADDIALEATRQEIEAAINAVTDEADARDTARALYRALGITPDEKGHDWSALQGELWPALKETYADLRRVGLFLSRDESLFPGLIAAVRARRASPAKANDASPAAPVKDPVPAPPT